MRMPLFAFPFGLVVLLAAPLAAQQPDPAREIQEIARTVDEQLKEIDRLLLESSKKNQARSEPKGKLQQAHEHSRTVEDGINRLIEKLNEMKNQSGGGGGESNDSQQGQQDQQQQQQNGGQQQSGGQRRENQTPDFVQQPRSGQQPGQEQGQQQQSKNQSQQPGQQPEPSPGQQPIDGKADAGAGENRIGPAKPEGDTGPGNRGQGADSWGELQSYVNFLKNRGSSPKVPEKYRKYWEAYLKQNRGNGGK